MLLKKHIYSSVINLWTFLYFHSHISILLVSFVKLQIGDPQYPRVSPSMDSTNPDCIVLDAFIALYSEMGFVGFTRLLMGS